MIHFSFMKKLFFVIILFPLANIASGQTWAPTGAKWTYGVGYMGPYIDFREWVSTSDTIVGGHNCKLIKRNGSLVASDISSELITYEDSSKVYWYNINQFTVLYDFNKNVGDTWTIFNDTCSLLITVDSIGIDTINGFPLKALYISSEDMAFTGKILQHIGHLSMPNPAFNFHCFGIFDDTNYYTGLRCYEDSVIGFHSFGIAPSCDYTNGINELENPFGLLLFPNPTSNQLNIKTNFNREFPFKIYNTLGQLVKKGNLEFGLTTILIDDLSAGVYSIELIADYKTEIKCFVVEK